MDEFAREEILKFVAVIVGSVFAIIWTAFPFVVMSRLRGIEDHLKAIRGEVTSLPLPTEQPAAPHSAATGSTENSPAY